MHINIQVKHPATPVRAMYVRTQMLHVRAAKKSFCWFNFLTL